jgi:hypothetical protein
LGPLSSAPLVNADVNTTLRLHNEALGIALPIGINRARASLRRFGLAVKVR